ncbi:MAG: alpha/beta fold hydrolase [Spirochaetales bacterium]|nr:alpha/beta fold hydrolase [Spirochaetales bacterium]
MDSIAANLKPEYYKVKDFRLVSGEVLPEMVVEYVTLGRPARNAQGEIDNAVLWCHGWSGSYLQGPTLYGKAFGPGRPLDPEHYYIICPSALGSPGSSSPSTSGLGPDFPTYTIIDMVEAQRMLLTKHLGISHLRGVAGGSMGGHQTLQWICDYPDFMDWAIPIATGPSTTGRVVGIWGLMSETIKADPAYRSGHYTEQPKDALRRAFMGTYLWYFAPAYYQTQFRNPEAVMKGLEDAGMGNAGADANDVIWRNSAMISFNVENKLHQVKAKTLVVGVNDDALYPPAEEFYRVAMGIPGAKLFAYDSILGHIGNSRDLDKATDVMKAFIDQVEGTK